jgi:hypothetical protein
VGIAGRPRHIVDRGVVLDLVGVAAPDRDGIQVAVARELDILDVAVLQRVVAAAVEHHAVLVVGADQIVLDHHIAAAAERHPADRLALAVERLAVVGAGQGERRGAVGGGQDRPARGGDATDTEGLAGRGGAAGGVEAAAAHLPAAVLLVELVLEPRTAGGPGQPGEDHLAVGHGDPGRGADAVAVVAGPVVDAPLGRDRRAGVLELVGLRQRRTPGELARRGGRVDRVRGRRGPAAGDQHTGAVGVGGVRVRADVGLLQVGQPRPVARLAPDRVAALDQAAGGRGGVVRVGADRRGHRGDPLGDRDTGGRLGDDVVPDRDAGGASE